LLRAFGAIDTEAGAQIDDRDLLTPSVDHAFHELRSPGNAIDRDHSIDVLHLSDVYAVLCVTERETYHLERFTGELSLSVVVESRCGRDRFFFATLTR
jgi:hypothetical protein